MSAVLSTEIAFICHSADRPSWFEHLQDISGIHISRAVHAASIICHAGDASSRFEHLQDISGMLQAMSDVTALTAFQFTEVLPVRRRSQSLDCVKKVQIGQRTLPWQSAQVSWGGVA